MEHRQRSRAAAFGTRNARTIAVAVAVALLSSSTAAGASYLVLSSSNTATRTTTLKSSTNAAVLQISNTNTSGGTAAKGIGISVPSGRAPLTVNAGAGKATNLNADKLDGIDSSGFVRGPAQAWRELGATGNPALVCLADNAPAACEFHYFGFGFNTPAFYKDPFGVVHLKGIVQAIGTFATPACQKFSMFTLPSGYRPTAITVAPSIAGDPNVPARIDILTDGRVTVCLPNPTPGMWFLLDGISFRAG